MLGTGGVFLRRNFLLVVFVSDLHILRLGVVEVKSLSSHLRVELEVISPLVTDGGYKVGGKPVAHDGAFSNTALAPIVEEEHVILALSLVREVVIVIRRRDYL